jgi:poly-beta-1,6 N-acetyl-D-glucosamine synthase
MQAHLGRPPRALVWPFGRYSGLALDAARGAGFSFALTLEPAPADASRPMELSRYLTGQSPKLAGIAAALRFADPTSAPRRIACLNAAGLTDAGTLGHVLEEVRSLGANTVVLGTAADPATVSFAAWQLRTRAGVDVFLRLDPDTQTPAQMADAVRAVPVDGVLITAPGSLAASSPRRTAPYRWIAASARSAIDAAALDTEGRRAFAVWQQAAALRPELQLALPSPTGCFARPAAGRAEGARGAARGPRVARARCRAAPRPAAAGAARHGGGDAGGAGARCDRLRIGSGAAAAGRGGTRGLLPGNLPRFALRIAMPHDTIYYLGEGLAVFCFGYPFVMAWFWMMGALLFWFTSERHNRELARPPQLKTWPPISIVVPCHNEIATAHETFAVLAKVDYPEFEIIAVNDGSRDDTGAVLDRLAAEIPQMRVVHLARNQGKATAMNVGGLLARYEILVLIDGDALLDPYALRWIAATMQSPELGGLTGNPRIRNRSSLLGRLQVGEFSSIIGLIKRAQSTYGRLFTVSGVICAFRRRALEDCGWWSPNTLTDDVDVTWRFQRAGWRIVYVPNVIVWILMPETLRGLWRQRLRWAEGGGHMLHDNALPMLRWRSCGRIA